MNYCKVLMNHPVYYGEDPPEDLIPATGFLKNDEPVQDGVIADYIECEYNSFASEFLLTGTITRNKDNVWSFSHIVPYQEEYYGIFDARTNELLAAYMLQCWGLIKNKVKVIKLNEVHNQIYIPIDILTSDYDVKEEKALVWAGD